MYADESASADRRFESSAVVPGDEHHLGDLRAGIEAAALRSGEAKFAGLTGDSRRSRDAASFVQRTIEFAAGGRLRVDVIIWDNRDERHAIAGRDDAANFTRMAYHLIQKVCQRHCQSLWSFFPDRGAAADWMELAGYVENTPLHGPRRTQPQTTQLLGAAGEFIHIDRIEALDSGEERLVQVADLFAGMACFSRCEAPGCGDYLTDFRGGQAGQTALDLGVGCRSDGLTRGERAKYDLVCHTYSCCKSRKLGVSLPSCGCLTTRDPSYPVNFWHYEPQHGGDRAPTRCGR